LSCGIDPDPRLFKPTDGGDIDDRIGGVRPLSEFDQGVGIFLVITESTVNNLIHRTRTETGPGRSAAVFNEEYAVAVGTHQMHAQIRHARMIQTQPHLGFGNRTTVSHKNR